MLLLLQHDLIVDLFQYYSCGYTETNELTNQLSGAESLRI
jgi:hypothetical protein